MGLSRMSEAVKAMEDLVEEVPKIDLRITLRDYRYTNVRNIEGRCNACNAVMPKGKYICIECVKDECPNCKGEMKFKEDRDDVNGERVFLVCTKCPARIPADI